MARFKISPHFLPPFSKRKRKHSRKHKKKHEKRRKRHSESGILEGGSKENIKDDINAKEKLDGNVDMSEQNGGLGDSEISNVPNGQILPTGNNNIQTESECQKPELSNKSLNEPLTLTISNIANVDLSIPTSPCETHLKIGTTPLVSPEIEQAVASISGPNLSSDPSPKNNCDEDQDIVNNTVLPLTTGTLEIESAVNSILGETTDLGLVIPQENVITFDIKPISESTSQNTITEAEHPTATNTDLLEKHNTVNGELEENHGTFKRQEMSEFKTIDITNNSQMAFPQDSKEKHNGNHSSEQSLSEVAYKENDFHFVEGEINTKQLTATESKRTLDTPNINSTIQNGKDKGTEKSNLTDIGPEQKEGTESLNTNKLLTQNILSSSCKPNTNFDIPNSQNDITRDKLEKTTCPSNSINSPTAIQVTNLDDSKTSNLILNNGNS